MRKFFSILLFMFFLAGNVAAAPATPTKTLEKAIQDLISTVSSQAYKQNQDIEAKRAKILDTIKFIFDPYELAKRSLGQQWPNFSPEQQTRFQNAFVGMLERNYLERIENYSGEKVVFDKEVMIGGERAEVYTHIITSTSQFPVVYRMNLKDDQWKVLDIIIEGVSLVNNYRSQFMQILQKETPEQLIERISKK